MVILIFIDDFLNNLMIVELMYLINLMQIHENIILLMLLYITNLNLTMAILYKF
jgi:hypothetical protein